MSFIPVVVLSKELLILNDSFVVYTVMSFLLILFISIGRSVLVNLFDGYRLNSRHEFALVVNDFLNFFVLYQNNLETLINLNFNRVLLLPEFNLDGEDLEPRDFNGEETIVLESYLPQESFTSEMDDDSEVLSEDSMDDDSEVLSEDSMDDLVEAPIKDPNA